MQGRQLNKLDIMVIHIAENHMEDIINTDTSLSSACCSLRATATVSNCEYLANICTVKCKKMFFTLSTSNLYSDCKYYQCFT